MSAPSSTLIAKSHPVPISIADSGTAAVPVIAAIFIPANWSVASALLLVLAFMFKPIRFWAVTPTPKVGVISSPMGLVAVLAGETLMSRDVVAMVDAMVVAASMVMASDISSQSIQSPQLRVVVDAIPNVAAVVKVAKEEAVIVVVPERVSMVGFIEIVPSTLLSIVSPF